ncbi:hypothetical protein NHF40_01160 [Maricaulaceae bacterium EIL42A08]|nr:hypothetical protein [Maricaulaceae bacterium EIL42A08]
MRNAVTDLATLKPIDLDAVEKEIRVQRAIDERNTPEASKEEVDLSFANTIADRLGSAATIASKDAIGRLVYQRTQAAKACEGLDFEKEKNQIRSRQSEIRVEIRRDEDDLNYAFELFQRSKAFFDQYREERSLVRPAKRGEQFGTLMAFLAIIASIEAIFNAIFLAPVDPAGIVFGWITAVLISLVNVGLGFAVGNGSKLFNSIRIHAKILGATIALIGTPLLFAFHYLVMKYRAEMSLLGEEVEAGGEYIGLSELFERTWVAILEHPFAVGDMISFIVFIVGVFIACLAIRKGFTTGDPYPGYTAAQAQFEVNRAGFVDRRNGHLDELQSLRDDVIDQIDQFIRDADAGKTKALNWAQQSRALLQSYRTFTNSVDTTASQLIERYLEPIKGREKTAVRKRLKERIEPALAHAADIEALVDDVVEAAERGAEDAREARRDADELRTETIASIDKQIADFKEKFD